MKKNKKGFTLVELIICLAIVAALTLAATLGLQKVLKANKVSTYKNDLKEVADSARQYLVFKKIPDSSSENSIRLSSIVGAGLISDDFYKKTNGLLCSNFSSDTQIYYKTVRFWRICNLPELNISICNANFLRSNKLCIIFASKRR